MMEQGCILTAAICCIVYELVGAIIQVSQHKMTTVVNALGTVLENISKVSDL